MRIFALICMLLALYCGQVRADVVVVADPDKWIEQALGDITQGKTDEFARNFLTLIDKTGNFDAFAGNMRMLAKLGTPAFVEKVSEVKFGDNVMREVIYLALYGRTNYTYFKFTVKKNRGGFLISNFEFKVEPADLFPPNFASQR